MKSAIDLAEMSKRGHPMKVLDLSYNKIEAQNLSTILNSLQEPYCQIQVLKLSGITPNGVVRQFMPQLTTILTKNTSILSLSLSNNNIDHVAARSILQLLQDTVPLPPPPELQEGPSSTSSSTTTSTPAAAEHEAADASSSTVSSSTAAAAVHPSTVTTLTTTSTDIYTSQIANLDLRNNKLRVCFFYFLRYIVYTCL